MSGRGASGAVITELGKAQNAPFHLMEARFDVADGGTLYRTDSYRSVVWNGNTYLAGGDLIDFQQIEESAELKLTQAVVTVSGVNQAWMAQVLSAQYIGRIMVVYKAFYNASDQVIVDPFAILQGPMDEPETAEDPAAGTHVITIRVTSLGADLESPAGFHTNLAEHQALYPGDLFMQNAAQVAGRIGARALYWGRPSPGGAASGAVAGGRSIRGEPWDPASYGGG